MSLLHYDFYQRANVLAVARELIGKVLCCEINSVYTAGIITETEAYAGVEDRASHAFGGRRTNRNEAMYSKGGTSYVYLCYGIHQLFNVVTNLENIPHAVLIRGIQPLEGIEFMLERRKKSSIDKQFSSGPGTLTQALGINRTHNLSDLTYGPIWIEDRGFQVLEEQVVCTPRIGIDYAGDHALLPYRFVHSATFEV